MLHPTEVTRLSDHSDHGDSVVVAVEHLNCVFIHELVRKHGAEVVNVLAGLKIYLHYILLLVVQVLGLQLLDFDRHLPLLSTAAVTGDGLGAGTCFHLNRLDVEA